MTPSSSSVKESDADLASGIGSGATQLGVTLDRRQTDRLVAYLSDPTLG